MRAGAAKRMSKQGYRERGEKTKGRKDFFKKDTIKNTKEERARRKLFQRLPVSLLELSGLQYLLVRLLCRVELWGGEGSPSFVFTEMSLVR